jgi:NodT family efflux transporter outer membrane factor (OMF) lipoprotein
MAEALDANPDLKSARAKLREARARRLLAGAERLPGVTGSASASRAWSGEDSGGGARNLFSAGFDASWEPDVFGGIARGIEAAQADQEARQASLDNTRVTLVAEVALNYVELRANQGRLAIARDNLASQAETLQLTEWRAEAGLTTILDVEQARANLEQTRAQIPAYETGQAEARNRLAILLGKTPGALDAPLDQPGRIPAVPDRVLVGIPADTLRQRPDVRAAERGLAAETARLGVAEANRYPSFTLSGSLGLDALTLGGLGSGDALAGSLLAKLAGTLFDGGRLKQKVEIQSAVQEQALIAYESSVLTALEEVENALVALANGRRRQTTLGDAARAAGNAAQLARQQYLAGLVDFQTVLNTQRSLLSAQDSLKSGEADTATALIRLYKALGGGWSNGAQP